MVVILVLHKVLTYLQQGGLSHSTRCSRRGAARRRKSKWQLKYGCTGFVPIIPASEHAWAIMPTDADGEGMSHDWSFPTTTVGHFG